MSQTLLQSRGVFGFYSRDGRVSERRSQVDLGLFISELHHLQQGAACRCGGVFQSAGLQENSTLNASNGDLRGFHHMTSETINALAARSAF